MAAMPMPTRSVVLKSTGCTRDDVNNWLRRGYIPARINSTSGVATELRKDAAMAIAFMAALTGVGVKPSRASEVTRHWLGEYRQSSLKRFWTVNPRAQAWREGTHPGFSSDEPITLAVPATTLVTIDRGTIVRLIESLFKGAVSRVPGVKVK